MQISPFARKALLAASFCLGWNVISHAQNYDIPPAPRPMDPTASDSSSESAVVSAGQNGRLQVTSAPVSANRVTSEAPPENRYFINPEPRKPTTGYNFSVFAGASLAREDDLTQFGGLAANSGHEVGPLGGFKLGYVWPFTDEAIEQFELETSSVGGVRLSGGLELEAFYLGSDTDITTAAGTSKVGLDMGFMMVNATLQAQWGDFRLYAGPGVGLAIIGSENDTQAELAYQIMGGLDYFITPEWSIFGEYKYLIVNRLVVTGAAGGTADFGSQYGQHILAMGLRKHF
jgi:opacity protein-like surface antigen